MAVYSWQTGKIFLLRRIPAGVHRASMVRPVLVPHRRLREYVGRHAAGGGCGDAKTAIHLSELQPPFSTTALVASSLSALRPPPRPERNSRPSDGLRHLRCRIQRPGGPCENRIQLMSSALGEPSARARLAEIDPVPRFGPGLASLSIKIGATSAPQGVIGPWGGDWRWPTWQIVISD
jgi:hypothetical protein